MTALTTGVLVLVACSDDSASPGTPTNAVDADAGPIPTESGVTKDADIVDATAIPDASTEDAGVTTFTVSSTGLISIYDFAVIADFYEDNVVMRNPSAPDCVAHVRSETKPRSAAGKLTIGGDAIGKPGGPAAPVEVTAGAENRYESFLDTELFFAENSGERVQLELEGTGPMPSMPVATLGSPVAPVTITAPTAPDATHLLMPLGKDFEVTWTPIDAGAVPQRVSLILRNLDAPTRQGDIYCSWPMAAGKGTLPAAFLGDVRARLGGTGEITGQIEINAGDSKEVAPSGASYFITVLRAEGTTTFVATNVSVQ